jgi:hypothetical protein
LRKKIQATGCRADGPAGDGGAHDTRLFRPLARLLQQAQSDRHHCRGEQRQQQDRRQVLRGQQAERRGQRAAGRHEQRGPVTHEGHVPGRQRADRGGGAHRQQRHRRRLRQRPAEPEHEQRHGHDRTAGTGQTEHQPGDRSERHDQRLNHNGQADR